MENFRLETSHPVVKHGCGDHEGVRYYCINENSYCNANNICIRSKKNKTSQQTKYQYKAYLAKKKQCQKEPQVCFFLKFDFLLIIEQPAGHVRNYISEESVEGWKKFMLTCAATEFMTSLGNRCMTDISVCIGASDECQNALVDCLHPHVLNIDLTDDYYKIAGLSADMTPSQSDQNRIYTVEGLILHKKSRGKAFKTSVTKKVINQVIWDLCVTLFNMLTGYPLQKTVKKFYDLCSEEDIYTKLSKANKQMVEACVKNYPDCEKILPISELTGTFHFSDITIEILDRLIDYAIVAPNPETCELFNNNIQILYEKESQLEVKNKMKHGEQCVKMIEKCGVTGKCFGIIPYCPKEGKAGSQVAHTAIVARKAVNKVRTNRENYKGTEKHEQSAQVIYLPLKQIDGL